MSSFQMASYERNWSPMILIARLKADLIVDKTHVKLFTNFTRHHLITHTYFLLSQVISSLTFILRPGNLAHNCKKVYWL